MTLQEEIDIIEEKLSQLRIKWKEGSPAMKKYIESGALLWKDKLKRLRKKINSDLIGDEVL